MAKVYARATARRDLVEHYVYLAENASQQIADRFLIQAETSFADLTRHPLMGTPLTLSKPALVGMRKWHIKRFEKFLIFYLPHPDGVSIVRVLHAAQDWWGMLGIEMGESGTDG
jgi:toxin ParE1/3/4